MNQHQKKATVKLEKSTKLGGQNLNQQESKCILMFSGGRDSTLAALRLTKDYQKLVLVTITSEHLTGIESVYQRLKELKKHLPEETEWLHIIQPSNLRTDTSFYAPTCLPCHHAYVSVGVVIAENIKAQHIAFGYVGYQSTWPEQTIHAVERLAEILKSYEIELILPVYDIESLDEVINQLSSYSISTSSLEQKCTRQVDNIELEADVLHKEISKWEKAVSKTLAVRKDLKFEIKKSCQLKDL